MVSSQAADLVAPSMAYTLIGGTIGGTALTLLFLPPLYVICVGAQPRTEGCPQSSLNNAS